MRVFQIKEELIPRSDKIFVSFRKVNYEDSFCLIFKTTNHKLGQVRFDTNSKNQTFITYAVANEFRGAKHSSELARKLEKEGKLKIKTPFQIISIEGNEKINAITTSFINSV